jgi:hypothetical protein
MSRSPFRSSALRRAKGVVAALALAVTGTGAAGEAISVARPHLSASHPGEAAVGGTVFFLARGSEPTVAVGAAHSFDLGRLAEVPSVEFRLGHSGRIVAVSSGLMVPPGRPFTDLGGSLADDFVAFALDAPPDGVTPLEPVGPEGVREGDRVRLLGVPATVARDQDDVFGKVSLVGPGRIEIALDVPKDLRGWGGAPVLSEATGRVLGILEAAWPDAGKHRLGAAPISSILAALANPLGAGGGEPFARFAPETPPSSRAGQPGTAAPPRAWPPPPSAQAPRRAADPGTPAATPSAREPVEEAVLDSPGEFDSGAKEHEALLRRRSGAGPKLQLDIEFPEENAVFGGSAGAFVTGRAIAAEGELRRFDVVIVLDTSGSTIASSGSDINSNGIVGTDRFAGLFGQTDPGDSILAAEVAAARALLESLDPRVARVGLVTFAGEPPQGGRGMIVIGGGRGGPPSVTEEPLTAQYDRIHSALDRVLARGPWGQTHMAAGVDQAMVELKGLAGGLSQPDPKSEKVVFFLTDGIPTLPYDSAYMADNVNATLRAADRSARVGVTVHTFAIGPEALAGPIAPVEIASRTGGQFTPVRHPADIVPAIETVNLANIDQITVRNLTNDREADELVVSTDGSWSALVPLDPGKNRIEVTVVSSDGQELRQEVQVQHAPDADLPDLPPEHVARRNRLLQERLLALRRQGTEVELRAVDKTRRELVLEIEREREDARARAEAQRKELQLEVGREPPPP